jgi:UDP-N-acetylmuramyl pentapeptide phosphotransferase/UDP-N-acetylglucosamine-1-phosphate transferase
MKKVGPFAPQSLRYLDRCQVLKVENQRFSTFNTWHQSWHVLLFEHSLKLFRGEVRLKWQLAVIYLPVVFILAFVVTIITRDKLMTVIAGSGFTRPNYKGENIPLAAGVVFFITALAVSTPLFIFWPGGIRNTVLIFLFAMAGATCLGLMDDFWGSRETSGLAGHFKALCKGNLTTGAVKALAGGMLALIVGAQLYPGNAWRIMDSALIIALSVNMVNLFDLRPGRAGKVYILFYFVLLPAALGEPEAIIATMVLGSLAAFLPADLKARTMMGDAGANTLGVVLGITASASLDGYYRAGYLTVLVILHLVTEKYSLTRIIAGNSLLNYLDMLGREKEPSK